MALFDYPAKAHRRRHGPIGYKDYHSYKPWLRDDFQFRCVYCLRRETWGPDGDREFVVEHHCPQKVCPGRVTDYENLLYACSGCNSVKLGAWPVPDPGQLPLATHLRIHRDGSVQALSVQGQDLIDICGLDLPNRVSFRKFLMDVVEEAEALLRSLPAGAPGREMAEACLKRYLGYPDDLPDLQRKTPPRNRRPNGVKNCYHALRRRKKLPRYY